MTDTENDEIFISGLPLDVTEEELATYFGQIGIIKEDKKRRGQPKIWLYRDKTTGEFKGEATVTYDDPYAASSAPSWFDNKEFRPGHVIKVSLSDRKANAAAAWNASKGGGQGRGDNWGGGGRRGGDRERDRGGYERSERGAPNPGQGRPGDWTCPSCGNNCFARRDSCNRCGTQRGGGGGSGGGGERGGMNRRQGDWVCSCGNNNYGFRDECFKCHAAKPSGGARNTGGGSGGGGGEYEGSGYRRQESSNHGRRDSFNHGRDRSRSPRRRHDDNYDSRHHHSQRHG